MLWTGPHLPGNTGTNPQDRQDTARLWSGPRVSFTKTEGPVGPVLRRRRSSRKKRPSTEAVCVRWPKVPLHEASVLQTDSKIE
jgi:hypothetical protein